MNKVNIESFYITGITVHTANTAGRAEKDIPQLWNKFITENIAAQIPGKTDMDIYCVYTEYEGDYTQPYTTLLGCKVNSKGSTPEGMTTLEIPAGLFQQFTAKGKMSDGIVFKQWLDIWQADIARAYKADFEVYRATPSAPEQDEVSIFVGLTS